MLSCTPIDQPIEQKKGGPAGIASQRTAGGGKAAAGGGTTATANRREHAQWDRSEQQGSSNSVEVQRSREEQREQQRMSNPIQEAGEPRRQQQQHSKAQGRAGRGEHSAAGNKRWARGAAVRQLSAVVCVLMLLTFMVSHQWLLVSPCCACCLPFARCPFLSLLLWLQSRGEK
jgi:hypothetical protein